MKIGITIGDINGIGPEIIIKALQNELTYKHFTPIIYGSSKVMSYHKNIAESANINFNHINEVEKAHSNKVNVLNCWNETPNINLGKIEEAGGKFAQIALEKAMEDILANKIDALVTAPIHKAAMKMAGFKHTGHTEFITEKTGGNSLMMMVSDSLRVTLVTNHLPLKDVSSKITKELVQEKLKTFHTSLIIDFGIERPTIAI